MPRTSQPISVKVVFGALVSREPRATSEREPFTLHTLPTYIQSSINQSIHQDNHLRAWDVSSRHTVDTEVRLDYASTVTSASRCAGLRPCIASSSTECASRAEYCIK